MRRGKFDQARFEVLSCFAVETRTLPDAYRRSEGLREYNDFAKLVRKLCEFGLLLRHENPDKPSYSLTPQGVSFLEEVRSQQEVFGEGVKVRTPALPVPV